MPRAVDVPVRQEIVARREAGQSLAVIAQALGLSFWTVRQIWRRYRAQGAAALTPDHARCGWHGPRGARLVWRAAVWLKRLHRSWGGGMIATLLRCRWPDLSVPHERTLQRWFRQAGVASTRRRRVPTPRFWSRAPHDAWQVDAKEQVRLRDGQYACWLTLTDEHSGAVLGAVVFSPAVLGRRATGGGAD
jgi:hypothetical protein